jgi:hypothetical protein
VPDDRARRGERMHPTDALSPARAAMPWATVTVVGLLGAPCAVALRRAGHAVSLDTSVEYGRIERSDLLVLALAPPEPTSAELVAHLRRRSDIPVLAFVPARSGAAPARTPEHPAEGGLLVCRTEAELLAAVARLARRDEPVIDLRHQGVLVGAD